MIKRRVISMRKMIYFLLSLLFVSSAYGVTIYKWTDNEGVIHFTDDSTKIPSQYRNRVKTEEGEDSKKVETPAPASVTTQKSEGMRVDRYGQGEDYWRAKVQPWKKQLKEATENYESTNKKIDNKLEEQSGRFLTPTQTKMKRVEMDQLRDEKSKYEAQIKEAKAMLDKLTKEAGEAKADPEWLK
jgi:hypothetical protein